MIIVMFKYRNSCLLPAGCVHLTHSNREGEGGKFFSKKYTIRMRRGCHEKVTLALMIMF